ncbi:hypothetical protein ACVWZK_003078 [Bradyrhizobium sp. GM0.4]
MQMQMFDPRMTPTATAEMLADVGLHRAIATMRKSNGSIETAWPYVERIGDRAWAVDDGGLCYVVVGLMVFDHDDLDILERTIRKAAKEAFARLDAGAVA